MLRLHPKYYAREMNKINSIIMEGKMAENNLRGVFDAGGPIGCEVPKYYAVKIEKVANGFIVEISCKKFVGEKWDDLAKKLAEYWKDPMAAIKKYCK
jgi:hypothetical protein